MLNIYDIPGSTCWQKKDSEKAEISKMGHYLTFLNVQQLGKTRHRYTNHDTGIGRNKSVSETA